MSSSLLGRSKAVIFGAKPLFSRVGGSSFLFSRSSSAASTGVSRSRPEYMYNEKTGEPEWVDEKAAEEYFASLAPGSEEAAYVKGKSAKEILTAHVNDTKESVVQKNFLQGNDANFHRVPVTIERARFNAMQSPQYEASKEWVLTFPRQGRWKNSLMGWDSFSDTLTGATALGNLKFGSLDDALTFCRSKGMRYTVKDGPRPKNTMGQKSYGINFLNYHITQMTKQSDPIKAREQFRHPEAGKSAWVNLKHTDYGKTPSENVTWTHWKDENSPRYHDASGWAVDARLSSELGRKLGK